MRKVLAGVGLGVALTLAAGGAYIGMQELAPSPAEEVCGHLMEVCEPDGDPAEALAECVTSMEDWNEDASDEDVARLTECVVGADGCAEASGCLVGHGLRQVFDGAGDFFKGVGNALGLGD